MDNYVTWNVAQRPHLPWAQVDRTPNSFAANPRFVAERGGVLGRPSYTPAATQYSSMSKPAQAAPINVHGIRLFQQPDTLNHNVFRSNFPRWRHVGGVGPYIPTDVEKNSDSYYG